MPSVDLKLSSKIVDKLKGNLQKAAGKALYSAALRGVSLLQVQLIPAATPSPVDRGLYRAGWRVEPHMTGAFIDGADIYNVEPQAVFIERGVRGQNVKIGGALIRALSEWAKRKGLEGADDPKKAKQIAWAIALSMKRKGIFNQNGGQGLRILEKLMTLHMPGLVREEMAHVIAAASK